MEAKGFDEGAQEDDVGTLGIAQVGGDFRRIDVPDGDVFLQFFNDALGILAGAGEDGQGRDLRRIDDHLAVFLEEAGIAGGFHFFKGDEDICCSFADDGRIDFFAEADLRADAATALAHAVDFRHLDIVPVFYEADGEDLTG